MCCKQHCKHKDTNFLSLMFIYLEVNNKLHGQTSKVKVSKWRVWQFKHSWCLLPETQEMKQRTDIVRLTWQKKNSVSQTRLLQSVESTNETARWRHLPISWCEVEESAAWIIVTKHCQETRRQLLEMGENYFYLYWSQTLFTLKSFLCLLQQVNYCIVLVILNLYININTLNDLVYTIYKKLYRVGFCRSKFMYIRFICERNTLFWFRKP